MKKFKILFMLMLTCILFINLNSANGQNPPINSIGVGVDIIQGFQAGSVLVTGTGCGKTKITLYSPLGQPVLQSPVFSGTSLNWTFSTVGRAPGTYAIRVYSITEGCTMVKQLVIN